MHPPRETIRLPRGERPMLTAVIDTEEEFDWGAPVHRGLTSVSHMREIGRLQEVFDRYSLPPAYVVDFPIASQEESAQPLRDLMRDGRAVIGAHLHPWVSPPLDEELTLCNQFHGNLPRDLEHAKIRRLADEIRSSFGHAPVVFKAGRYGIGANTYGILEQEGFELDLSPAPPNDYRSDCGPDFSRWSPDPFWFGQSRPLLCLPRTGGYAGWLGGLAPGAYIASGKLGPLRARGILSRLHAVNKVGLSPEDYSLDVMKECARYFAARGLRVFSVALHSPTCAVGHTPYAQTRDELRAFIERLRAFLEFFTCELNGVCVSVLQIRDRVLQLAPPPRDLAAIA